MWALALRALARYGRKRLVSTAGPVVSLTSHGSRLRRCHITIESIGRGDSRPSRLLLWIDDPAIFESLPPALVRLQRRGLEVRLTSNYGPHTKYYPFVSSMEDLETPLVTADDDVIYPPRWLSDLVEASGRMPACVVAYRARRISVDRDGAITPYDAWPFSAEPRPSVLNFGTGHSGVLYPSAMQKALRDRGEAFVPVCPRADDVWLHNTALREGIRVSLVRRRSVAFDTLSGTQRGALKHSNVTAGANDEQIRRTYSDADLDLLNAAMQEELAS
ncbi:hypothetical protein [Microbacterium arborescens]|uniref:hypothetical protein n=1 Tax=Microbacterium arborescens TaxID=33883 RepID=UPI003C78C692